MSEETSQEQTDSTEAAIVKPLPYEEIIWLSTLKAAHRMGITTRTLYRFIDQGDVIAYRFGRVIRLKLSDVDAFVERCRVEPGSLEHLYPEARPADADNDHDEPEIANGI